MAASYFLFLTHTVSGDRRKCMIQTQSKAHLTWMILESSSKEFLQSPQYSWANWSMYLFTLAEVELIPPLLPDSSWNRGENKKQSYRGSAQNQPLQNSIRGQHPLLPLTVIKASVPQPGLRGKIHLSLVTCGFSGAASFTLHSRFSSCGRCPMSW